jgi:hypothetical protein
LPNLTHRWLALLLGMGFCLVGRQASAQTDAVQRRAEVYAQSLAYGAAHLSAQSSLVADELGRDDVAGFSVDYVVAAVLGGQVSAASLRCLAAVLAQQDTTPRSSTLGLFPEYAGSTPSLEATASLLPLLACIYERSGELGDPLKTVLRQALELGGQGVAAAKPPPTHPYLALLRSAALARVAKALGDPVKAADLARAGAKGWLDAVLSRGDQQRPGGTAAAWRLGALIWLRDCAGNEGQPDSTAAVRLAALDLWQRRQPGGGATGGATGWAMPDDYLQGAALARWLWYVAGRSPDPVVPTAHATYFAEPDWGGQVSLPEAPPPVPYDVTTLSRGEGCIWRSDTHVAQLFSLGTLSGPAAAQTIPALVTFGRAATRPTAYFYPDPAPARITSVQQGNQALVTADFDQVGLGERANVCLRGALGPRAAIHQVLVNGGVWPGDPAAIGESGVVAVERDGVFVGVRLLQSGPALRPRQAELPKPGVLLWAEAPGDAELQLLSYPRKRSYEISPAEDNYLASLVIWVVDAADYPSLRDFSQAMQRARAKESVTATVERLTAPVSPYEEFLRENDPKSRADYSYKQHLLHEVSWENGSTLLHLGEDVVTGQVLDVAIGGQSPAAEGSWMSPLLALPWQVGEARRNLTGSGG